MRFNVVLLIVAAAAACAPVPYGSIPIDPVGLRERWRRACELGKVSAADDGCEESEGGLAENESTSDSDEFTERADAVAIEPPDVLDAATNDGSFSSSSSRQPSYGPDGG